MLMNHLMQFLGENKSINRPAVVAWFVRASVFHSVNYAFPQRTVDQTPLVENLCLDKSPQTNPDSQPRSAPALELLSSAESSVGVTSPFQRSQHREQYRRKADKKINNKKLITS